MTSVAKRFREEAGEQLSQWDSQETLKRLTSLVLHNWPDLSHEKQGSLICNTFYMLRCELDVLQPYADDPEVSELMVNGTKDVFIEKRGVLSRVPVQFDSEEQIEQIARRLAAKVHREMNDLSPIVDARMEDGSRFHAVGRNVAIGGPVINIRRFPNRTITMEDWVQQGDISREGAQFLQRAVECGYNIFISGGTSSGKTTFLNALTAFIPSSERVIVIEDAAELQVQGLENVVRLETKKANSSGKGTVTMSQLIRSSLRMRPDRIIVGEVRGEEVLDMVQAMNTGHDGSLSTGHGNSPEGMLSRLEAMYLTAAEYPLIAVRQQLTQAIDLVVHLGRLKDHSRKVLQIAEIQGLDSNNNYLLNRLFQYEIDKGLVQTGKQIVRSEKAGLRNIRLMD